MLSGRRPRHAGGISDGHTVELHGLGVGAGTGGDAAAGLTKTRAEGRTLGPPRKLGPDQVETARRLRQEKVSPGDRPPVPVERYLKTQLEG